MSMKSQQGVALIQVLLISFMLIVLTVQLSKESREQVKTAIAIKQRSEKLVTALSTIEQSKFFLLTESREQFMAWGDGKPVGFFGEPVKLDDELQLVLQDEAGLLSLPYSEETLVAWLDGQQRLVDDVKHWQGSASVEIQDGNRRNGLMPVLAETSLLPGWENIDLSVLTHLPTAYFSLVNAPEKLLKKIYANQADELIAARNSGKLSSSFIRGSGLDVDADLMVLEPSEITRVKVIVGHENKLMRSRKFVVDPGSYTPILELGY